jgi:hypothetical protein
VELYLTFSWKSKAKLCEKKPGGRAGLRKFARAMRSMFGSVRAARAPQDDLLCFVLGRWRAKVRGKQSVVLRDKKNPLWDTELQFFTRSVPFWQGRTVVRGSFPETFLEVSVTGAALGKQLIWW